MSRLDEIVDGIGDIDQQIMDLKQEKMQMIDELVDTADQYQLRDFARRNFGSFVSFMRKAR
ncbi:MAG: hypothetical protein DRI65_14200 [Chloroflexota bacterium]|nr:MAG: hypothetical protein DRI65_14200 [Chloroflexota bacterium]